MKKKLIMFLIIGLLLTSALPLTIGAPEKTVCGNGDYNLVVSIEADRRVFRRIYTEGVTAQFIVWVHNKGPDVSDAITVNGSITRIIGRNSGDSIPFSWVIEPLNIGCGLGKLASSWCNNDGAFFGVFRVRATVDKHDNNLDDNTASFIFISLTLPRIYRIY
jgi:hypothetical protein